MRLILFAGVLTFLTSCAWRTARIQPSPLTPATNDFIDIQAGWRLSVVTPMTKSGGYVPKSLAPQRDGNTITLSAGEDLVGYEVAHYAAIGARGGRVRIEFSSAEVTREGKTETQARPTVPLFQLARRPNYLRLIYLIRISHADHNMAVVAARRLDALQALTRRVEADPADGCTIDRYAACAWIPDGIAVRPEVLKTVDGIGKWVDAPRE